MIARTRETCRAEVISRHIGHSWGGIARQVDVLGGALHAVCEDLIEACRAFCGGLV